MPLKIPFSMQPMALGGGGFTLISTVTLLLAVHVTAFLHLCKAQLLLCQMRSVIFTSSQVLTGLNDVSSE